MPDIRIPQARMIERHGDYEIWLDTKFLPQILDGHEILPSMQRRTVPVYSVRRLINGIHHILSDNHQTKGLANGALIALTTFARL